MSQSRCSLLALRSMRVSPLMATPAMNPPSNALPRTRSALRRSPLSRKVKTSG